MQHVDKFVSLLYVCQCKKGNAEGQLCHSLCHSQHDPYASASELGILSIWHLFNSAKIRLYFALIPTFPHTLMNLRIFLKILFLMFYDHCSDWNAVWQQVACCEWQQTTPQHTETGKIAKTRKMKYEKGKFVARQYKLPFFQYTIDFSSYE